jgi:flagellum-specific ATP synthase
VSSLDALKKRIENAQLARVHGRLKAVNGPLLRAALPGARMGTRARVGSVRCEVVGMSGSDCDLLPLDSIEGLTVGAPVTLEYGRLRVPVGPGLIGRIVDPMGEPMDGGPPITGVRVPVHASAPDPLTRPPIDTPLWTNVRVLDGLLTLGRGQRMAILAGSGVGKSTLLGMLASQVACDVNVICLVGERGREVREFIDDVLGPEGLARSVVVVATSDTSPGLQVKAPLVATAIAEAFRSLGQHVLLMMDSLTRLALAQRQIGLAAGEPPATRGYPPSVFGMLPTLLERAGTSASGGSITGIYTVLVEGDDIHDPIADAVRGIADGHIVLSRDLANAGHYPAIDALGSVSRVMNRVVDSGHLDASRKLRALMATWAENEELVRLGAYTQGASPEIDRAIQRQPAVRAFLRQGSQESCNPDVTRKALGMLGS